MQGLITSGSDGNSELATDSAELRNRSRKFERDQAYALKMLNNFAIDQVGTGLRPDFETGKDVDDRLLAELWEVFASQCDGQNGGTIYGMQTQLVKAIARDGGTLSQRMWCEVNDVDIHGRRLVVPLQIQPLEIDYLATFKDGMLSNGHQISGGIEFDGRNRRVGYHVRLSHPGATWPWHTMQSPLSTVFVSVADMAHAFCYNLARPGQVVAAPWMHAIITRLYDFDGWIDGTMFTKRASAVSPIFLEGADCTDEDERLALSTVTNSEGAPIEQTGVTDSRGYPIESWQPGVMAFLPPNRHVKFPEQPNVPGHEETMRVTLQELAAGGADSYEGLTGDLSRSNFISIRAGKVQRQQIMDAVRDQVTIPMIARPHEYWFLDAVELRGLYRPGRDGVKTTWIRTNREEADELTRVKTIVAKIRGGLMSWRQAVIGEGMDPEVLARELSRSNELLDGYNIILDSDPRRMTQAGQPTTPKPTTPTPPTK